MHWLIYYNVNSTCWEFFCFVVSFFQKLIFHNENLSGTLSECQTVCKGYQQATKSLLERKELNISISVLNLEITSHSKLIVGPNFEPRIQWTVVVHTRFKNDLT